MKTNKKPIRNIAVSGVDSYKKFKKVCKAVGDIDYKNPMRPKFEDLIIYDDGYANKTNLNSKGFMFDWTYDGCSQSEKDYQHCKLFTFKQFKKKYL